MGSGCNILFWLFKNRDNNNGDNEPTNELSLCAHVLLRLDSLYWRLTWVHRALCIFKKGEQRSTLCADGTYICKSECLVCVYCDNISHRRPRLAFRYRNDNRNSTPQRVSECVCVCVCEFLNANPNIKQFKYLFVAAFFNGSEPRREWINPDAFSTSSSSQLACARIAISNLVFLLSGLFVSFFFVYSSLLVLSCMRRIVARNYTICCILFDASTEKIPSVCDHPHTREPQEHSRFIINSMWVGLLGEAGAFFNYTAAECKIRFHIYPLLVRLFLVFSCSPSFLLRCRLECNATRLSQSFVCDCAITHDIRFD